VIKLGVAQYAASLCAADEGTQNSSSGSATFFPLINSALQLSRARVTLLEHKVPHASECFFPFLVVGHLISWTVNKAFFPAL
jgi:hypothetical protein